MCGHVAHTANRQSQPSALKTERKPSPQPVKARTPQQKTHSKAVLTKAVVNTKKKEKTVTAQRSGPAPVANRQHTQQKPKEVQPVKTYTPQQKAQSKVVVTKAVANTKRKVTAQRDGGPAPVASKQPPHTQQRPTSPCEVEPGEIAVFTDGACQVR